MFVSDEVIFGFGRTGKWFGCAYYDTKLDLIYFSKAVTNGLVMRATGDTMFIAPPLIMTLEQIDELFEKAKLALDNTQKVMAEKFG